MVNGNPTLTCNYLLLAKVYNTAVRFPSVLERHVVLNATSITPRLGHDVIFKETDRLCLIFHLITALGHRSEEDRPRRAIALIRV